MITDAMTAPSPISEESSEKRKRGRPPRLETTIARQVGEGASPAAGPRARVNRGFAIQAMCVLQEDEAGQYGWLFETAAMTRGDPHSFRPSILAELGRIDDEELLKECARIICDQKPTARDAIIRIRRLRRRSPPRGDAEQLQSELRRVLNEYLVRFPETPQSALQEAVAGLTVDIDAWARGLMRKTLP